jgi:hypothetical protein
VTYDSDVHQAERRAARRRYGSRTDAGL